MEKQQKPYGIYILGSAAGAIFFFIAWLKSHDTVTEVICILLAALLFWLFTTILGGWGEEQEHQEAESSKEKKEKEMRKAKEQKDRKFNYQLAIRVLERKYGVLTKKISLGSMFAYNIKSDILFFNTAQVAVINGHEIPFSKILAVELKDDKEVHPGSVTLNTSTDKVNMYDRAIYGYMLDGERGLKLGALTAAKQTTVHRNPDSVYHNYEIVLTVDSFEAPVERIAIGSSESIAEQLNSLFTVIIRHNIPG